MGETLSATNAVLTLDFLDFPISNIFIAFMRKVNLIYHLEKRCKGHELSFTMNTIISAMNAFRALRQTWETLYWLFASE